MVAGYELPAARLVLIIASILLAEYGKDWMANAHLDEYSYRHHVKVKTPFIPRRSLAEVSPSPVITPSAGVQSTANAGRVYHVTGYSADPTGLTDSTDALMKAIADACRPTNGFSSMQGGIADLGGSEIDLDGGVYLISRPLTFPGAGGGNLRVHGGSLRASDNFPIDGYLINLQPSSPSHGYEDITFEDLMLDASYRGGGISVLDSLRTTIGNCYVSHFMTNGILVKGGHETYIHNSFIGQHITAGGDPGEKNFSGVGINLMSNDNAVTDVVIFSGEIGILISGQANTITGVHCYNKAIGWGGTGIYLRTPGLSQTRIVNCYLDYTGIVAEDPVQLHISNSFFLGGAFVQLKSVNGMIDGLNIVDNMFSGGGGGGGGQDIVQLDQSNGVFTTIKQVVVDRNNVRAMNLKATTAKGVVDGNGTSIWMADFSKVLLFPNLIRHVQYTFYTLGSTFPNHVLRDVSKNMVVVQSDADVSATVYVSVDQNTLLGSGI